MKIQFCVIVFFLLAISSFGQDSLATTSKNKYSTLDFGIGYLHTDLSSINGMLTDNGYKPLNENFLTYSVAGAHFINRILLRIETTFVVPHTINQGNYLKTRFTGYTLGMGVGYAVIQQPKLRLYPYIGINAYSSTLVFEDNTPVASIDGALHSPHQSFSLLFANASLDLGFQVERVFEVKNDKWDYPQRAKYRTLGIRMGYHLGGSGVRGRYNSSNQPLENAPVYSLKGPYVKVVIGVGTKSRLLKWKR